MTILEHIWELSPHQHSYMEQFLSCCDIKGKDVLELGGAMPKALVIDHLKASTWTCLQSPDYAAYRTDNQIPSNDADSTTYAPVWANAEDFLANQTKQWDYVFSIAAFEHFLKLPTVTRLIPKVLKPGGRLFSIFAPIWSGPWGHHFTLEVPTRFRNGQTKSNLSTQDIFNLPWDHLALGPTAFLDKYTVKFDRQFAEEMVYEVYHSPQINRLMFEDYHELFSKTDLKTIILSGIFNAEQSQLPQNYLNQLAIIKKRFEGTKYSNFHSAGVYVLQERV